MDINWAKDNKIVVLGHSPKLKYRIWHTVNIIKSVIGNKLIKPLMKKIAR